MKRLCDAIKEQPHHNRPIRRVRKFFVGAATALSFLAAPFVTPLARAQEVRDETKKPGTHSVLGGKKVDIDTFDQRTVISVPVGADKPIVSIYGPVMVTFALYPLFPIDQKGDEVTVELITMLDDKNFIETTTAHNPGIELEIDGKRYRLGEPIMKTVEIGPGEHQFIVISKNVALAVSSISILQTAVPVQAAPENQLQTEATARFTELKSIMDVLKDGYNNPEYARFSKHVDSVGKLIASKRYGDAIEKAKYAQGLFYGFVQSEIERARKSGSNVAAAEQKLKELNPDNLGDRKRILLEALALAEKATKKTTNGIQLSEEQVIREFNEVYGALQFLIKGERYGDNPNFGEFRSAVVSAKKNIDRKKLDQAIMDSRYAKTLLYEFVASVIKAAEEKELVVAEARKKLEESRATNTNDRVSLMLNALGLAENAKAETFDERLARWRGEIDKEYEPLLPAMRSHGIPEDKIGELQSSYDQFIAAVDAKKFTTKQKYDPLKEAIARWKAYLGEEVARVPNEEPSGEPQVFRTVHDARYGVEYSLLNVAQASFTGVAQQNAAAQHRLHAFARFFRDGRVTVLGSLFGSADTTTISFPADPELRVEGETLHNSLGGSIGVLLNAAGGNIIARTLVGVSQTTVGLDIRGRSSTVNGNTAFFGGELLFEHDNLSLAGSISNDPFFPAEASMSARLPYTLVRGDTSDLDIDFLRFHLLGAIPSGQGSIYDGDVVNTHTVVLARIPLFDFHYVVLSSLAGAYYERLSDVRRMTALGGLSARNQWGEVRGLVTQDGSPMLLAFANVPIDGITTQADAQYRFLGPQLQQAMARAFRY